MGGKRETNKSQAQACQGGERDFECPTRYVEPALASVGWGGKRRKRDVGGDGNGWMVALLLREERGTHVDNALLMAVLADADAV